MTAQHTPPLTKEGIAVEVGQVWRDLDKRMGVRHCTVIAIVDGRAHMRRCNPTNGRVVGSSITKVAIARMHRGSTGWQIVSEVSA